MWTLELTGGYVQPIRFSRDRLSLGTAAVGYYLKDNLWLGAAVSGYHADQPGNVGQDTGGAGIDAMVRLHLLTVDRLTLYADGGGGVSMWDAPTPEFGTHFNFTGKAGVGLTYRLDEHLHLLGGARYFHLSNGNIHGRDQNPSFDGVQFYGGVMFTF